MFLRVLLSLLRGSAIVTALGLAVALGWWSYVAAGLVMAGRGE